MSPNSQLPRWADIGLIPLINVMAALFVAGIVIAIIGENPFDALLVMIKGAFVYKGALGYTLYYTTNFIFTGLAVAVAFHAMLFNIGGEGQAYLAGLGAALVCLALDAVLPGLVAAIGDPCGSGGWCCLGGSAGLAAGQTRQPYCYHDDHVQLSCRPDHGLTAFRDAQELGRMSPETRSFADEAAAVYP